MARNPKAADVIFVFPPGQGNLGAFRSHLGVAYLRAALAKEPITTAQYLNPCPGTIDEVAGHVLAHKPRIVGFTVYDANLPLSVSLASGIKRRRPDVKVVFGGPSATFCAQQILESQPVIDACVIGEAEETGARIFAELLDGCAFKEGPPGAVVRRAEGLVSTGLPPLVGSTGTLPPNAALDTIPSPYLTGVLTDGRAGILTGRGCTHFCQYCCFAALGRKKLRVHSIERVLAELEYIADHQRRSGEHYVVPVQDDAFTLLPSRAKSICQAIADRDFGLVMSCITRADAVDDELLRMMREAGFISLAFGLESAVPSVLRETGKVRPPDWQDPDLAPEREFIERVRTSVVTAKKYGFHVGISIILGLPGETAEDGATTLRFVQGLPIDFYMHNFLWVFPGTPLWETHKRYGIDCKIDSNGLAVTTDYAYDLAKLRPSPGCSLEQDALLVTFLATDSLYGCDNSDTPAGGTSIAIVSGGELKKGTAEWLRAILNVGSILVQPYEPMKHKEGSARLLNDRGQFSESGVPARHHIQLLAKTGKRGRWWTVACSGTDLYCTYRPSLVSIREADSPGPLLDWIKGTPTQCTFCDLTHYLSRPDELVQFLEKTGEDSISARMRRMSIPPSLKYPGRWLGEKAPCLSLTRIEVDQAGCVRPCRHGEMIGKVGDTRKALVDHLTQKAGEVEQRRGCATCHNMNCPRCPFPGVDDDVYCRIMRKQAGVLSLLKRVYLYSRIPLIISLQRDRLGGE